MKSPVPPGFARRGIAAAIAAAFGTAAVPTLAQLPTGAVVVNGTAGIVSNGAQMTITNSPNAVLNWQAFSIGANNSVRFNQANASSQVLNRVVGNDPSNILGSLSSNGKVWLVNPYGVLFGANARVDVGGLVASSLAISNGDFLAGRLKFDAMGQAAGQVLNRGEINTSLGGHVLLVGGSVSNEGLIRSPGGQIVLAAGTSVELVDSGAPNVAVRVTAPGNEALNLGTLLAPGGGSIDIHGGIVNQQGIVRADSVATEPSGRIVIKAQGDIQLGAGSETSASAAGTGGGGKVLVESTDGAALVQGRAGATSEAGAGGQVHLLGKNVGVYGAAVVDASGATGGGEVLAGGDYQGKNPLIRNADATYFGPRATVLANATGTGNGGKVIFWGNSGTRVYGTIAARGGQYGGDGGFVETSGHVLNVKAKQIDVAATKGKGGTWLLDPGNITIGGCCSPEGGLYHDDTTDFSVTSNRDDAYISPDVITGQLRQGTKVIIKTGGGDNTTQAGDIIVAKDIVLADDTSSGSSLSLLAHNDIVVNSGVKINAPFVPITLTADSDNSGPAKRGAGNITLGEGAQISTEYGIALNAGTSGTAPSGTIVLEKNSVLNAGSAALTTTRLEMQAGSQVNAPHITVAAGGDITITNGSLKFASTLNTWNTSISVTGKKLTLDGGAIMLSVTEPDNPVTSDIAITASSLDVKNGGIILARSTSGAEASSTVTVNADTVTLANSTMSASAGSERNSATIGNMLITSQDMTLTNASLSADGPLTISSPRFVFSDTSGKAQMKAASIRLTADDVELYQADITASGTGTPVDITTNRLTNTGSTLSAPNGRWLVHLRAGQTSFPAVDLGTLDYKFVQVNATETTPTALSGVGQHGILMADPFAVQIKVDAARPYDGTDKATFYKALSSNVLPGFQVAPRNSDLALQGTFNNKNADLDKPITYTGDGVPFQIVTSTGAPVYGAKQSYLGDIQQKTVSASAIVADNKVYDGKRDATVHGTLSGVIAGDNVALGNTSGLFDTRDVGTNKTVTISGGSLSGADAGNYILSGAAAATTASITPKPLSFSPAGLVADNKVYDGKRDATVHGSLSGIVAGDKVTLGNATGLFDTKDVGKNKPVTISGGSLGGADAGNYSFIPGTATTTADITPKAITSPDLAADNKVYDGNRNATVHGTLSGVIAGDNVTLGNATGLFDTRNVGTNKTVTVTDGSLSGTDAGNYTLAGATTADITAKTITASSIVADNKVYDGTRDATVHGTLSGTIAGDDVALGKASGLFDTRNVGTNKTVTLTGGSLSGADGGNYILSGNATTTAEITPKAISASGLAAADKVYDGTRDATVSGTLSGIVAGDDVTFANTSALFDTRNVGANKTVTISAGSLIGTDAGNYTFTPGATTTTASITPKPLSFSPSGLVADNKVYDGTRDATVHGTVSGIIAGDDVALGGAAGQFDTKNVGTRKTVTIVGGSLSGADGGNYILSGNATTTADITPKPLFLSASGILADNKVYDGNRNATVHGTLSGIISGDDVALGNASGQFDTKNVGTHKTVTISGGSLSGADGGNYILSGNATTTADITPKAISASGLAAADKVYDGTRDATVSGTLSGIVAGDDVTFANTSALFDTRNAGANKTVTISAGAISGADAGNYAFTPGSSTTTASITPKALTVSGMVADNKVYDGNRDATVHGSLSGVIAGDNVALGGASGLFDTKNVGANKAVTVTGGSLSGTDAGNYTFSGGSATTTASITPKTITASGIVADNKVYDGTRDATVHGSLSGVVAGDKVALGSASGQFDTKNVGTNKTVTLTGGSLAGLDAGNYTLTGGAATTADITRKELTVAMSGQTSKEYDATASASLGGVQFAMNGLVANDAVTIRGPAQGSYDTPDVGERKLVSASGPFEISGADAGNYKVGNVDLNTGVNSINLAASANIGSITPALLTITATPAVRDRPAPLTGLDGTVTGFKGTDSLSSATTGTLQWNSNATPQSLPGSYAINGAGLDAKNYRIIQAPGNATALLVKLNNLPTTPLAQVQQASAQATIIATNAAAIPLMDSPSSSTSSSIGSSIGSSGSSGSSGGAGSTGSGGGLMGDLGPAPARTFGTIRIGAMNQDELAQMLAERRDFKKKLFAEAIYKLEIDPSLADVQSCPTVADAATGTCRLTATQLEQMRAAKPKAVASKAAHARAASLPQIQRKVIVLFGINNYADKTIPPLENAVPDVDAVARIFTEKLGYEARIVRNPTKADIIRTLNDLATEVNSDDSVVVYYAGHGYSLEKNGAGYWVPSDGQAKDPHGWISNSDVAKLLSSVSAKQMALISDSCYSGAFAREGMEAVGHDVTAADVLAKRSVVVISSGGDEPVADEGKDGHSIFAWNLMRVLGSVSDWKPGSTIFTDVQTGVKKEFPQTPKYGSVTAAGHQRGGDYLFEIR